MRIRLILLGFVVVATALFVALYPYIRVLHANYGPAVRPPAASLVSLNRELDASAPVFLRIFKQESQLEIWAEHGAGYTLVKTYPICRWSGELGPKLKEGDRQSPEGFYHVRLGSLNPDSNYHLSFNLGFPNSFDRAHGRTGSYLMVHGRCSSIGCFAMTDPGIEEIYRIVETALRNGQEAVPVHIFPFRMTEENLERHAGSQWIEFWLNLKQGYDAFEADKSPPSVTVAEKSYRISQR